MYMYVNLINTKMLLISVEYSKKKDTRSSVVILYMICIPSCSTYLIC